MNSIIQTEKECFVCKTTQGLHSHHCFGSYNRNNSEKYGLKVWLCGKHHNLSSAGVHFDKRFDLYLKRLAQSRFEEVYPDLDFVQIFNKSYT